MTNITLSEKNKENAIVFAWAVAEGNLVALHAHQIPEFNAKGNTMY